VGLALLIAQVSHGLGEGMGIIHLVVVGTFVLGGLAFVLVRGTRRGSGHDVSGFPDRDPDRERGPEA
jgi:hypothetical protein